jgi:hypothetical protein
MGQRAEALRLRCVPMRHGAQTSLQERDTPAGEWHVAPRCTPAHARSSSGTRVRRLFPARATPATAVRQPRGPPGTPLRPVLATSPRWPSCWCAPRGQALTQAPCGITLQTLARSEERPQRHSRVPSGAVAICRTPSCGGWRVTGTSGTGRAQRRRCLPCAPPGGQRGKARRSVRSSALPRRRGARTSPGSPATRGGSLAATVHQPLHGPVRGRLRRQAYRCDSSCVSLVLLRRRGGFASAVCAMAQPWTTVAWAARPAPPQTQPPQRRLGWLADCDTAKRPGDTARTRATATGHRALPAAGGAGAGGLVPLPGQTVAAGTTHAPVVAPIRCSHALGKTGRMGSRTGATRGVSAGCLLEKHVEARGAGQRPPTSAAEAEG